jgi:hypothetical protein
MRIKTHNLLILFNEVKKTILLLIIKIKNIHEFKALRLNLWIFSIKKSSILHWLTLPHFHPIERENILFNYKHGFKNNLIRHILPT